jgi:hypothetical protein
MSHDVYLHANFLRGIAIILVVLLGVVPIWFLFDWGIVIVHPYVALVSIIAGTYMFFHQRKLRKLNTQG